MTDRNNLSGKLLLTLFASLFAIAFTLGGTFGARAMYKQLYGWWEARSFVPVAASVMDAQLESRRGSKGGTTYRATAEFAYQYKGRNYTSSAVDLSGSAGDNVGDYQESLYQQLRQARDQAIPVTLWVNPQHPDQSVYNRDIRWLLIIIMIPFAVLFPAIGLGATWVIWRIWHPKGAELPGSISADAPPAGAWMAGGQVIRSDRSGLFGLVFTSAFWNILCWPIVTVFFATAPGKPWWLYLILSIFPVIGLFLLAQLWKNFRAYRRIGRSVLQLQTPGVPGFTPLQGQIRFQPALGTALHEGESVLAVKISVECLRNDTNRNNSHKSVLWQGTALHTRLPRGTESLNFSIDLPQQLAASTSPFGYALPQYWRVVVEALGEKVNYKLPVEAVSTAAPADSQTAQGNEAPPALAQVVGMASGIRKVMSIVSYLFITYFLWIAITEFAIPYYQSRQAQSQKAVAHAPVINAHFELNSLSGNGFGVVAKAGGEMEIGDNTLRLTPASIEVQSFGTCAPDCPLIESVEFSLSKDGERSFRTIAGSAPLPVHATLPDIRLLPVIIPQNRLPIVLSFSNREELAGLRLTLEIRGRLNNGTEVVDASWYTHAEPFAAAMGQAPAEPQPAADKSQHSQQAHQSVVAGRTEDLKALLQAGTDPNQRDAQGQTLLMRAADRGDLNSVQLLLEHGARATDTTALDKDGNGGLTALHAALRQDAVEVVDALIRAGADANAIANQVWTPMHYAAYRGATRSIRYLHEHGASVDAPFRSARGSTPLMVAAQYEQIATLRTLLELGANPGLKDVYGEDACGYARFFRKPASLEALGCK